MKNYITTESPNRYFHKAIFSKIPNWGVLRDFENFNYILFCHFWFFLFFPPQKSSKKIIVFFLGGGENEKFSIFFIMGVCLNYYNSLKFEAFGVIRDEKASKTFRLYIFFQIQFVCFINNLYSILCKKKQFLEKIR